MIRRPIAAALCSATLSLSLITTTAPATTAAPQPTPAGASSSPGTHRARAEADRLKALAAGQRKEVDAARKEINRLVSAVAGARAAQFRAQQEEQQALAAVTENVAGVTRASLNLGQERRRMGQWAADAYRSGISDPALRDIDAVMSAGDVDRALGRLAMLQTVGQVQDDAVHTAQTQETDQRRAAAAAARYRARAAAAAERAAQATITVNNALAAQQNKVRRLVTLLNQAQARASAADRAAWAKEEAARRAVSTSFAARATNATSDGLDGAQNRVSGPTGACQGGDTWSFTNGRIPLQNLCALWAAPGHYLRADAAFGFDRMNEAYLAAFGRPICITDSYRPYDVQVKLKAAKPRLAATPGRSNHGWGVAVDLCGGINTFGSPEHEWMRANAGQFGWYHPTWAQQGGSKPEAWHWQYRW